MASAGPRNARATRSWQRRTTTSLPGQLAALFAGYSTRLPWRKEPPPSHFRTRPGDGLRHGCRGGEGSLSSAIGQLVGKSLRLAFRRLFDEASGRPGEGVFETNLLHKLEDWARRWTCNPNGVPRILMLVGGPGNGKTEAIESTVGWMDKAIGADGGLVRELARSFLPSGDGLVPRLVRDDAGSHGNPSRTLSQSIVQDASAVLGTPDRPAAQLLLEELEAMQSAPSTRLIFAA